MVTGILSDVDLAVLPDAPQNVIAGLVDAALTGEGIVRAKRLVTRMTLLLCLAKGEVTRIAGPMPEKGHHHLGILI